MRWWAVIAGGVVVLSSATGGARAQPLPSMPIEGETGLEYVREKGAELCPKEGVFRQRAGAMFDQEDPFVASGAAAPRTMRVTLSRAGSGYKGVYSLREEGRMPTESIDRHESCDVLVWELAERMSLAIGRKPAPPTPPPECPLCPVHPEPLPPASVLVRECDRVCMEDIERRLAAKYGRPMDLNLAVMVGGILTAGWTLEVGPGAFLGFDVRRDWWSVGVEARAMFPATAQRYYLSPPVSDLVSYSGLLVPCARWKVLFGCVFAELGGYTFTLPASPTGDESDVLFAFGPRVGVDVPIAEGFSVRAFADLAIHPYGTQFDITDLDDPAKTIRSWHLPHANGFFSLGIAWSN